MNNLTIALPTESANTIIQPLGERRKLLTPIPGEPHHYLLVIDNSSLEKFTTCPRSAEFYLVHGREAAAKNAALVFGGAIHAGLETLLKGGDLAAGRQAIVNFFAAHPVPMDDYRTCPAACEILGHYAERSSFPDYEMSVASDPAGLLVERSFELPLGVIEINCRVPTQGAHQWGAEAPDWTPDETEGGVFIDSVHIAWSGRIDGIAYANGRMRVLDHKTTSIGGDAFIQDFQISNQTLGYVWAGREKWPELDITGFLLNAIHFKRPTGKTLSLLDRGPRGGDPALSFFRSYFDYTPERIAWWKRNVHEIISDFIYHLVRGYFTSTTKNCFAKYGRCQFHDLCTVDNPNTQHALLQAPPFVEVTWNPVRA